MQLQSTALSALKDTIRVYPGGRFTFKLTSEETNGALAIIDVDIIPGNEPPRHYHEVEDETNLIKEGTITYFIGDDIIHANAGDIVFMPRGVPHNFKVTSEKASVCLIITPGGFENFFSGITRPCDDENMQLEERELSKEEIENVVKTAAKFKVKFV